MTGRQLLEWQAYSELEPFGEERADLRLAAIIRMLFLINRDPEKVPNAPGLGAFYGAFLADIKEYLQPSETSQKIAKRQTWQEQKAILLEFAVQAAAVHEAELRRQERAARRSRAKPS